MLISGKQLIDTPVMSLQTGKELARTDYAIVNPHDLTIIAYRVKGKLLDYDPSFLRIADVREIGQIGMIVDSSDEFIMPDDIVSDKKIYKLQYELIEKQVVDDHKHKIGKVEDYIIDLDSFVVEQLVVKRPLFKSFSENELVIGRKQILEVTDDEIIVKSAKVKSGSKASASKHYVNPFRQTASPQPETIRTQD